jgi:hypothetical protein
VCATASLFVHFTVEPTLIVIDEGENALLPWALHRARACLKHL